MSVREQIMGLPCNAMNSYSDSEFSRYRVGFHHAKIKAADIAEAREKELLAKQAALIAELREEMKSSHSAWVSQRQVKAILAKYEAKP